MIYPIILTQLKILEEIDYLYTIMSCYKDQITSLEILDISGNYHIIDWEYPRGAIYKIKYKMDHYEKKHTLKIFRNLMVGFESIIKNHFPFTEFNLNIRNKISEPDKVFNRCKIIPFDKSPIDFIGWNIIGSPIQNKYFAITKFKYRRKTPNTLSSLCNRSLKFNKI
jgi:hypothetical protein